MVVVLAPISTNRQPNSLSESLNTNDAAALPSNTIDVDSIVFDTFLIIISTFLR